MNITQEQIPLDSQPHIEWLESRGYKAIRSNTSRYFRKGSVFISFNKKLTKCVILRRHPLRPEVFNDHHPMNVCYRGKNPWNHAEFAANLWEMLGLNFQFEENGEYGSEDDMIADGDVLTEF